MKKLDRLPLRRALISVYDKTNLAEFARGLHKEYTHRQQPCFAQAGNMLCENTRPASSTP